MPCYKSRSSSRCSFLQLAVSFSFLGPKHPLQQSLLENTQSMFLSLTVKDQVSHPYETTDKIIVLYILLFVFEDNNQKDKRFWNEW
jgi:hypothetical protein